MLTGNKGSGSTTKDSAVESLEDMVAASVSVEEGDEDVVVTNAVVISPISGETVSVVTNGTGVVELLIGTGVEVLEVAISRPPREPSEASPATT